MDRPEEVYSAELSELHHPVSPDRDCSSRKPVSMQVLVEGLNRMIEKITRFEFDVVSVCPVDLAVAIKHATTG